MPLKRTALYDIHLKYKGKLVDFAGYELPIQYDGIKEEHQKVRKGVGLFDVSHMGEVFITGLDARKFINDMITNDISELKDGQIAYSPICYENGGTLDDVLVYCFHNDQFMIVVNGANVEKDFEYMKKISDGYNVDIENTSNVFSQIAIQGPKSVEVLKKILGGKIENMKYYHFEEMPIDGIGCIVSRTGYTGEDGFEIYIANHEAIKLWEKLMDLGKEFEIQACGLGCRDTLRFEAGMPLYGNELSEKINPIEAGLSYFVKLDKENFIGKKALLDYKVGQNKRKLLGFELLGKGIPRHGYIVENTKGEEIGVVTTGYLSPTLGKSIGLALVEDNGYKKNDEIIIVIRKKKVVAKIINKRFLNQL